MMQLVRKVRHWRKHRTFLALVALSLAAVLFTIAYFAENPSDHETENSSESSSTRFRHEFVQYIYFLFVSLSTIGYGDFTPKGTTSKALGAVAAMCVLTSTLLLSLR